MSERTCETCRWWREDYTTPRGRWGFCLNPVNDEIDTETNARSAVDRKPTAVCDEHQPRKKGPSDE